MATKSIPIKDICIDGGTQQRPVEDNVVKRYAAMMQDGSVFPPVEIITDGKNKFLVDGFHRYFAAKRLGKKYIEASVVSGTHRQAIRASFAANKYNAVPRPDGTVGCTRAYVSKRFAEFEAADKGPAESKPAKGPRKVKTKRSGSEYEMKVPEKKVLDSAGKQVPKHLVTFFERANEYRQMIKQLNDMLKTVRNGKDAGDLFYRYIKIENLTAEVGNVKRIFRFALPYAVCSYCGGDENNDECRACGGCGFVNEMTYKSTPKDLKC
jgi:hypothetical protein